MRLGYARSCSVNGIPKDGLRSEGIVIELRDGEGEAGWSLLHIFFLLGTFNDV